MRGASVHQLFGLSVCRFDHLMGTHVFWRTKLRLRSLLLSLLILLCGVLLTLVNVRTAPHSYADVQLAAAERMDRALRLLREQALEQVIGIEPEDLNQTGLIGPVWTTLTTSVGSEDVKRSALQPDWAALMVRFFMEAGLRPGNAVAAGFSGSFPGLCLATVCAANELDLDIRLIPSLGSSMYGATRPSFHIVDILETVRQAGIVDYEMLAVSLGGDLDQGRGIPFFPDARETLLNLAQTTGFHVIDQPTLAQSIQERLELFGEDVRCFVNVGGASTNIGNDAASLSVPNGLVRNWQNLPKSGDRGLLFEYLARDVSVVNLLNIRSLAERYGLPQDPVPLTAPGDTNVYYTMKYPRWPALITLPLGILPILVASLREKKEFRRKRAT